MNKKKAALKKLVQCIRAIAPEHLGLLVPVSGGSDSALCWWLCNEALPGRVLGVFAGKDLRQEDWFKKHGELRLIELPDSDNPEIARWAEFMAVSIREKRVLVGSRNRTEDELGTYSLTSRLATFLPIVGVWKSDVIKLCESIGVPKEIIDSSRRADPACGRPAELAEIPMEMVDGFLGRQVKLSEHLGGAQREYLQNLFWKNAFRQRLPQRGSLINPL